MNTESGNSLRSTDPPLCPHADAAAAWSAGAPPEPGLPEHTQTCEICGPIVSRGRANAALLSEIQGRLNPDPAITSSTVTRAATPQDPASELPIAVDLIPGYTILAELGEGGQGAVYKALQNTTRRPVAVKLLRSGKFADLRQQIRFEREAEIIASLDHPGIVRVIERFAIRGHRQAIVMEFVDGVPLDQWTPPGNNPEQRRRALVEMYAGVCDAIAYAHRNAVIHRDIKPSNILVDSQSRGRVVDFGIAKFLGEDDSRLTLSGESLFTPAYASPEQLTKLAPTDTLTDVYLLGIVLYERLCGRLPFDTTLPRHEYARAVLEESVPSPRQLDHTISRDLEVIVLKAMNREKARRYPSAQALADDLRRYLQGDAIQARQESSLYVARKWIAKRWIPITIASVLVLAAGASIASARRNALIRDESAAARGAARANSEITERFARTVSPDVSNDDPSVPRARDFIDNVLIRAAAGFQADSPDELATMRTMSSLSAYYRPTGASYSEWPLIQALNRAREESGPEHPLTAAAMLDLGEFLARFPNRRTEAETLLKDAARIFSDHRSDYRAKLGETQAAIGRLALVGEEYQRAKTMADAAVASAPDSSPTQLAEALMLRSEAAAGLKDPQKAQTDAREALRLIMLHHSDDSEAVARALRTLARASTDPQTTKRLENAAANIGSTDASDRVEACTTILALKESLFTRPDERNREVAETMFNLALAHDGAGQREDAAGMYLQTAALLPDIDTKPEYRIGICYDQAAASRRSIGRYKDAADDHKRSIENWIKGGLTPDDRIVVLANRYLALCYLAEGDPASVPRALSILTALSSLPTVKNDENLKQEVQLALAVAAILPKRATADGSKLQLVAGDFAEGRRGRIYADIANLVVTRTDQDPRP